MSYKSTSAIAREFDIPRDELFDKLEEQNLIYRDSENNTWKLHKEAVNKYKARYMKANGGKWIVWPSEIKPFFIKITNSSFISKSRANLNNHITLELE